MNYEATPKEKIEALREWCERGHYAPGAPQSDWLRGFLTARREVSDIIDPPKPRWRGMVDEAADELLDEFKQPPLATVLSDLAEIARGEYDPQDYLARIVAICEAQVGGGWQSDPYVWGGTITLQHLLSRLSCFGEDEHTFAPTGPDVDWEGLGHAVAHWLRDLTEDGAA